MNIVLGVIYRPPPIESKWLDLFEQELRKCQVQNKNIIIMGDFNVNNFKDDCHDEHIQFESVSYLTKEDNIFINTYRSLIRF